MSQVNVASMCETAFLTVTIVVLYHNNNGNSKHSCNSLRTLLELTLLATKQGNAQNVIKINHLKYNLDQN